MNYCEFALFYLRICFTCVTITSVRSCRTVNLAPQPGKEIAPMTTLYRPTREEIDHAAEAMTVAYTGDTARIDRAVQLIEGSMLVASSGCHSTSNTAISPV